MSISKISSFFKHRKIIFFALLFLVVAAVVIPQTASANWITNWASDLKDNIGNALIYAVLFVPLTASAVVADLSGNILAAVIAFITGGVDYIKSPAVVLGWPIVRDLANMMIVIGFVIIGIATALRIQEYEAKKLLAKMIVVALLVNFSLLICGVFIDGSNIVTKYFFTQAGSGGLFGQNIASTWSLATGPALKGEWTDFIGIMIGMFIFNLIAFFIYLLYALLLLVRVVALWILIIFSPIAFVCYVFPGKRLQGVWQMWWSNFLQWCLVGIPAGLMYYIAASMITKKTTVDSISIGASTIIKTTEAPDFLPSLSLMIIPGLFLIVGFFVSLKISAAGAGGIMKFVDKNKGAIASGGLGVLNKAHKATSGRALGALGNKLNQMAGTGKGVGARIGRGAGWAANALADPKAQSQKTKSMFGRGLERIGATELGSAGFAKSEELKQHQGRMNALIARGELSKVKELADGKDEGTDPRVKAGAIGALLESEQFDFGTTADEKKRAVEKLNHFQENGGVLGKYAKEDARYAEYDRASIRNTMATTNPNTKTTASPTGRNYTEEEAKEVVRDKAYASKNAKGVRDSSAGEINVHLLGNIDVNTIRTAAEKGDGLSTKLKHELQQCITGGTQKFKEVTDEAARLSASSNPQDKEKLKRLRDVMLEVSGNPLLYK